MHVLVGIALKSLLIAGLTLGLLEALRHRSAAERSWVAHIGLLALVVMAFAPLALPSWNVEAPAFLGRTPAAEATVLESPRTTTAVASAPISSSKVPDSAFAPRTALSAEAAATALYAVPAAILLLITFLALARLFALHARADVLVDGHWLSALARAQRRMGFKHGTALLTSDELASPISWGLMRPVILLNNRAVEASGEAEAILAHELAHVARMDWVKLLLARVATALFWFNPLVWLLAREAHQLREETADDAVLAADIVDTDYAQLLVGVARHECPGLLLGAHGVAPSKTSLSRRVARVLDGKSVRGPVARSFALGVFAGAVLIAAPLAALTLTPKDGTPRSAAGSRVATAEQPEPYYAASDEPADLPSIIATGVSTSVATAVAAVAPQVANEVSAKFEADRARGAQVRGSSATVIAEGPSGASVTIYPVDSSGRSKVVAIGPTGATAITYVTGDQARRMARAQALRSRSTIDRVVEMKASGLSPDFVYAIRRASPALRDAEVNEFAQLKAVGVTPQFVRDLVAAGLGDLDADAITQARALNIDGNYVRRMAAVGIRGDIEDYVEMRAVGVTPEYAAQFRKAGRRLDSKALVKLKVHGMAERSLRGLSGVPLPPEPPAAPKEPDDG